jgi:hypothetical protein
MWPNSTFRFTPETDTIFFRNLSSPLEANYCLPNRIHDIDKIQHVALPLNLKRIPLPGELTWIFTDMKSLKTLTLMIGCEEKSWRAGKWVDLRDLEEWYVDGRERRVELRSGWDQSHIITISPPGALGPKVDISKLAEMYLQSQAFESRTTVRPGRRPRTVLRKDDKLVNIRIVAW